MSLQGYNGSEGSEQDEALELKPRSPEAIKFCGCEMTILVVVEL